MSGEELKAIADKVKSMTACELTPTEKQLVDDYRMLSLKQRHDLLRYVAKLMDGRRYDPED